MRKPRRQPQGQGLTLTMEILGTVWMLPREPREAGEARRSQQRGTAMAGAERRGAEGAHGEIQVRALGQRVRVLRKGGFLPPSQSLSPVRLPLCSLGLPLDLPDD